MKYNITHKAFGAGVVTDIRNGYVSATFACGDKKFVLAGLDKYLLSCDDELKKLIEGAAPAVKPQHTPQPVVRPAVATQNPAKRNPIPSISVHHSTSPNSLLGPRSQSISFASQKQLFEVVGYLAHPGRVTSVEAEVPMDGRDDIFESMFPGQTYRPIHMGDTPSGMPNKLSPQFRINLSNIRNCPQVLKVNLGAGNSSCAARLNKSRFVMELVQHYGFRFGETQNIANIKRIAEEYGCLDDFMRGYQL